MLVSIGISNLLPAPRRLIEPPNSRARCSTIPSGGESSAEELEELEDEPGIPWVGRPIIAKNEIMSASNRVFETDLLFIVMNILMSLEKVCFRCTESSIVGYIE